MKSEDTMRRHTPRHQIAASALILMMTMLAAPALVAAAPPDSPWGANYFPNVPLVTQDGQEVRFYDDLLKGKAVVVNLIYTSCKDLCPLETAKLVQVQKLLGDRVGKDIFFYSISIDPRHDTPAVLKAYAKKFGAGPGWLFLTGKKADITLISKKLGLSSLTDEDNADGHQPSLMFGNEATGQWMRNSAVDNPKFLAVTLENFLGNGQLRHATKTYAEVPKLPALDNGEYLFRTGCSACHTIGKGDGVGPDLRDVTKHRDRAWLARFITRPDQMLADKDPLAMELFAKYKQVQMPNMRMTQADVDDVLRYLEALSAARSQPEAAPMPIQAAGVSDGIGAPGHEHHHHGTGEVK
jgi:protein SCO1